MTTLPEPAHIAAHPQPHLQVVGRRAKELNRRRPAGEDTQPILNPPGALRPRNEAIEEVIDGCGPIPPGLDPESVWALRRIAGALSRNRRP